MQIDIESTRSGHYTAKIYYYDETLQRDTSLYLCSKINPEKEALVWAESIYESEVEAFIVYGVGLAYHIKSLIGLINEHQKIYIIESNKEVWEKTKDYTTLKIGKQEKYQLLVSEDMKEIGQFLSYITEGRTKLALYKPCIKLIPDEVKKLRNILYYFNIDSNNNRFINEIHENYKYNHKLKCENVSKFYQSMINKPIIIVSGGPSLDNNVDLLKDVGEEVFIFSTGRTLKVLLEKGIRVDMFCIIDPNKEATYKQIEGVENCTIPFVFMDSASHYTVNDYKGPKYIAHSMNSPLNQKAHIDSGGSVATAMLDLAICFGGNPIIFIGQDLAYTNNKTHCDNSISQEIVKSDSHMKKVKGVGGEYLITTPALLSFKYWIEQKIMKNSNIRFINATEEGAYIEGCEHLELKKVLTEF